MKPEWIPAISTTAFLAIVWLVRELIGIRLRTAVKHEYEQKIETIKSDLRKREDQLRAKMTATESQLTALRSGALTSIVNRQAELYKRQLEAAERLWQAVIALAPAKSVASFMSVIKFDAAAKKAAINPNLREVFSTLNQNFDIKSINTIEASIVRPFVPPIVWAYYSAYSTIIIHSVLKMQALKNGIDKDLADVNKIAALVKAALPHQEQYIQKFGTDAFYFLLDELEEKILNELKKLLHGEETDKASIERAANILREVESVSKSDLGK